MDFKSLRIGTRWALVLLACVGAGSVVTLAWMVIERIEETLELQAQPGVRARIDDTKEAIGDEGLYLLEYSPENLSNFPLPFTQKDGRLVHVPAHTFELERLVPPGRDATKGRTRIAFVGGSTTMQYPRYVSERLASLGHTIESHNLGVPGSISGTTLMFMKRYLPRWKPDIVVVYHGFNDLSFVTSNAAFAPIGSADNADRAYAQLRRYYDGMADFCREIDCTLIVSTFAAPDPSLSTAAEQQRFDVLFREVFPWIGSPARYAELLDRYNDMVRAFATEHDMPLIDVAKSHPREPEFFRDECHRTLEGVEAHGKIVAEALAPILARRGTGSTH